MYIHISARGPELAIANLAVGSEGPEGMSIDDNDDGSETANKRQGGRETGKKQQGTKWKPLNVRKEFPETWLWTEEVVK